jgi:hypothetical protein
MRENGKMETGMEKENKLGLMVWSIMEIGKMVYKMGMVFINILMGTYFRVNLRLEKKMEKESLNGQMAIIMKGSG